MKSLIKSQIFLHFIKEINKTREEREERQRSTEKRTFTPPQDSNLFPKISMVDLSQVQLRSSRRSAQKPNVTSPSHDPTVTEDLAVSSKNPPQNSSSIEESEQQKTNTENVKEEEEILNTSNESNNNNNDKDVPENSKKLASIITSGVKLTESSEETPLTAEPQEIEVVLTWESKKNANQTPTPTNVNDDLLIVKEARKDTIDAFNTDTAEKEDKKVESQAQSKIVEESEIKLSDESEGIEKVTGKLPPKVPISPTATSTTTSPTSPSKTQPSPTASDIPRENIAALWRQREKEQKSESIKPSRPPLPPKKKTVLDKWNEQKAVTAAESDKISTGADNSNVGKVSGIIKKKSLETSSKNKENDSSKVSLTTTKSTTSVTSSSSETETVSVEIKENVEISQEEEQIEISEREGTVVQETQISKNIEANVVETSTKDEKTDKEKEWNLPKVPGKLQTKPFLTASKEKGVDASNPPEIPSGGIKKKNKIAAMFEEQERKRREEEAAAAAARPVPGRKVLNKLPWMQKEKDESTSNTLAAAPPPPRKLNAAFLTSTENTESDSTTTEPPKLKTGKIDSAISQRLESVFGSGKIQLPGMGRGIGIGGRKVLISAEDVEAEEGEERVRVIPGLKRPDLAERNSDESKKEHEEKIENKDAGEGGSAEEKHEKKTSKPLSHITKDRPRRPKPARALPPPPKTEKVDDSKTSVEKEQIEETSISTTTETTETTATTESVEKVEVSDKTVIESSTLTTEEEAIKEEKQEEGEIEEVEKKEIGEVVIMNEEKEIADDVVVMAESEEKEMADDAVAMAEFEEKELDNEVIVIENVTN